MSKNRTNKADNSLLKAIGSTETVDGLAELAEVGLDQFLENGLIQDIPFVGTLLKFVNTGANIKNC